jgi:hypothetical protein
MALTSGAVSCENSADPFRDGDTGQFLTLWKTVYSTKMVGSINKKSEIAGYGVSETGLLSSGPVS